MKRQFLFLVAVAIVSACTSMLSENVATNAQKNEQAVALAGTPTDLAVGDIVTSILSVQDFQRLHGGVPTPGTQGTWVLCDGNAYPNSSYSKLVGKAEVPNLQGRYPRGFRADLTPNVGLTQESATAEHKHYLDGGHGADGWGRMGDARGGGDNEVPRWTQSGNKFETSGIIGGGGNETRPATTVVNFFIRIN